MNLGISFNYKFDDNFENVTEISIYINNENFTNKTIEEIKEIVKLKNLIKEKPNFKKNDKGSRTVSFNIKFSDKTPLDNNFPSSLDSLITDGLVHNEIIEDLYKLLSYRPPQGGGAFNDEMQDTEPDEPETPPTLIKRRNKRKNKTMSKRDYIII